MSRLASARSLFPHSSSEGLFGVVSQTRETRMLEPPTVLGKTRLYGRLRGSGGLSRNYPASGSSDADPGDTHKEGHWDPHRSHASQKSNVPRALKYVKTSLGSQGGSQAGFRDPCDTRQGLDSDSAPTGEVRKLGLLTCETGTLPSLTPMSPSKHLTRGLCAWLFWGRPS